MTGTREPLRYAIEKRKQFHPVLSRAIGEADATYTRRHITEAQLKALSITATGGTQWACGNCGEHRKNLAIIASQLMMSDEQLQRALKRRRSEGGSQEVKVRFMYELKTAVDQMIADGHIEERHRVFGMSGIGLWSVPLVHMLAGPMGWRDSGWVEDFLMYPELQACLVAQKLDELMEAANGDFKKVARAWAKYLLLPDAENFAFRSDGVLGRLLADGHCVEL